MKTVPLLACVALLAGVFAAGLYVGERSGVAKVAELTADHAKEAERVAELATQAATKARDAEHAQAVAFAAIDAEHQKEQANAQANYERTVAALRAGTLRMRATWRCPSAAIVPSVAAGAGESDGSNGLREASAGRIVRAVAKCQAQRDGLQATLTAERR